MHMRGRASHPIRVEVDLAHRLKVEAARRRTTIVGLISDLVEPQLADMEREHPSRLRSEERTARATGVSKKKAGATRRGVATGLNQRIQIQSFESDNESLRVAR